jgi:iron complex transport system ATP-binding protein
MSFSAAAVSYRVNGQVLVANASLRLEPGRIHALLGPNGAGKTTLLKLLSGDFRPSGGRLDLNGRPLESWTPRDRARQRAVLPQSESLRFGFTAEQVVELGRLPCPRHRPELERKIVHEALAAAGVAHLAARKYPTLSGGERARVQFARVMAQIWEPVELGERYLLLDEPTASLDLAHQHECLNMARCFAASGVGVLAILHDPNLALRYADDVTLLKNGKVLASGTAREAITADHLQTLYGIPVQLLLAGNGQTPVVVVTPAARPAQSAA